MTAKKKHDNDKKRVAFIFNNNFFLGGGEISFFELIRTIDQRIIKPVVLVPASGEIEKKLKMSKIEVHLASFPPIRAILKLIPFKKILNLIKFFKKNKIDVIHINGSRACFYGSIAGRILRKPVIWHVRETQRDLLLYDWLLSSLTSVIICVSQSVQLKRFGRFNQRINKKITVVYNGVDTSTFHESNGSRLKVRTKLSVKDNDILIGLIGNIIPRKSQDFFIKGLAKAKQLQPDISAKVLIIGHFIDKQYSNYLKQLVTDLNLHSNIEFQEFTNDIRSILNALDIFVLASKSEGFCRSLLEAMSCGLPIIATKISEIEEAINQEKNGILVEYMKIEKMASAILTLCQDKNLRDEIGNRNRLKVERNFDLNAHSKAIESLYFNILKDQTTP